MSAPLVLLGASGHAKVVIAALREAGREVSACYDDDERRWGTEVLGVPVKGPGSAVPAGTPAVIAIGNNAIRKKLATTLPLDWQTVVHPRAWVHESVVLGAGTVVFAGAVLQPDTRVGRHVIVNTAASVDHDGVIGDYAHLAPGVHLAGSVSVGEGAFLGVNAGVIPGRRIGLWTTVGAGGIVVHDLPDGVTAVGVPARVRAG